jgi:hypothetical protein
MTGVILPHDAGQRPGPALDVDLFDALVEELIGTDAGARTMLIDTYLVDAEMRVAGLLAAAATGDGEGVARAAHGLRSASALLGALPLAEALLRCELAARSGGADLGPLAAMVEGEHHRVRLHLRHLRDQGTG